MSTTPQKSIREIELGTKKRGRKQNAVDNLEAKT